jgi:hemin uptake protein HemP
MSLTTTLSLPPLFSTAGRMNTYDSRLRLRSSDLFKSGSELIIEHRGEEYRLKLTRNDKLILNK